MRKSWVTQALGPDGHRISRLGSPVHLYGYDRIQAESNARHPAGAARGMPVIIEHLCQGFSRPRLQCKMPRRAISFIIYPDSCSGLYRFSIIDGGMLGLVTPSA